MRILKSERLTQATTTSSQLPYTLVVLGYFSILQI